MRKQRLIASLLLSVFFLTPLAPAGLAPPKPEGPHCVRPPLAAANVPSDGLHCHEAATHAHHSMASMPAASDPVSTDRQFRTSGCCTSHDCCNSTVRAQWANSVSAATLAPSDVIQVFTIPSLTATVLGSRFDSHSGRAPPAF
jgi:hypothetical protein